MELGTTLEQYRIMPLSRKLFHKIQMRAWRRTVNTVLLGYLHGFYQWDSCTPVLCSEKRKKKLHTLFRLIQTVIDESLGMVFLLRGTILRQM